MQQWCTIMNIFFFACMHSLISSCNSKSKVIIEIVIISSYVSSNFLNSPLSAWNYFQFTRYSIKVSIYKQIWKNRKMKKYLKTLWDVVWKRFRDCEKLWRIRTWIKLINTSGQKVGIKHAETNQIQCNEKTSSMWELIIYKWNVNKKIENKEKKSQRHISSAHAIYLSICGMWDLVRYLMILSS